MPRLLLQIQKFHVLSNGALVFWRTSNIMYRKMEETIHGNRVCIQPQFSGVKTQLTGKPSPPFERALNSDLEITLRSYIYFRRTCEYMQTGMHIYMRAAHTNTNRNTNKIVLGMRKRLAELY